MFNEYAFGGYLAYRFFPAANRRVFILGEGVLMGDRQLLRYQRVALLGPGWRGELDRTGVDYVVVSRGSRLDGALAAVAGWRRTYADATSVVYVRAPLPAVSSVNSPSAPRRP
jgi:hypothetical protein